MVVVGQKQQGRRSNKPAANTEAPQCLIGPSTDVKKSAAFVAACLRDGTPPVVRAISAVNVNNAVKTIALTRNYIQDEGLELYAAMDFPEYADNSNSANANMHVFLKQKRQNLSRVSAQLQVSSSSGPPSVAGALAAAIREAPKNLQRVCVSAAGPGAMLRAVKAIFLARHYLSEDNLDLSVVPEFENIDNGPSVVHLFCIAHVPGAHI